jgi:hypothetical protein
MKKAFARAASVLARASVRNRHEIAVELSDVLWVLRVSGPPLVGFVAQHPHVLDVELRVLHGEG